MRRGRLLVALVACAAIAFPTHAELAAARDVRAAYGFGTDAAAHVVRDSLAQVADGLQPHDAAQAASSTGGLVSDHDLFMLVEGARHWIGRNAELSAAYKAGRLPASYALLDGYDLDRVALRRSLTDALPTWEPHTWAVAPTLLGLPASPSAHDVAAGVVDDDPLAALHTGGQVLASDVHTRGVRYALDGITEQPAERAAHIAEVRTRANALAEQAERLAGPDADDYAYTHATFDLLADTVAYAEREDGARPHDNDVYGALVEGAARCYGLSGALKLLLDARGIPNFIADGSKPTGRHSWNVVWMRGSWRVCDLTLRTNACLALEQNFYTAHHYVLDDDCRLLELVYSRLVG